MTMKYMLAALLVASSLTHAAAPPDSEAVEFYNTISRHYFMTPSAIEANGVDNGGAGAGWIRTGRSFPVWAGASGAPADARPACRFYSFGANSHFHTTDPNECAWLKSLEASERSLKAATGAAILGWMYEGIEFYVQVPSGGACPSGTQPIWRFYNNGFSTGEGSNHRFVDDPALLAQMGGSWMMEGASFCAAPKPAAQAMSTAAQLVVAYVNDLRRSQGLQPVAPDAQLMLASQQFAEYMAATGKFAHDADGRQPWDRALQAGYRWCNIAENIAYTYGGGTDAQLASQLFEGWKASPPHLQNMLNAVVLDTGIGIARSASGAYYAVLMLGRRC
jgi:hypothetical protein